MDQLLSDIISTSFGGAAAGLALYGTQLLHGALRDRRDADKVFSWMQKETSQVKKKQFISTREIASYNNLTEDRVRYVCSQDDGILLAIDKDDDFWSLDARAKKRGLFIRS